MELLSRYKQTEMPQEQKHVEPWFVGYRPIRWDFNTSGAIEFRRRSIQSMTYAKGVYYMIDRYWQSEAEIVLQETLQKAMMLAEACGLTLVLANLQQTIDGMPGPRHLV